MAARDPLDLELPGGALLSLGVDPGTFFCGGHSLELARLAGPDRVTGFLHVPPDRTSCDNPLLPTREAHHEMLAGILSRTLARVRPGEDLVVLLTGFGPFKGAASNGTEAFVADPGNLDRVAGAAGTPVGTLGRRYEVDGHALTLLAGVLALGPDREAAAEGRYYAGMDEVRQQFAALLADATRLAGEPQVLIGLGVDSTQNRLGEGDRPRFKLETQSRGYRHAGHQDGAFTEAPVALYDLPVLWL